MNKIKYEVAEYLLNKMTANNYLANYSNCNFRFYLTPESVVLIEAIINNKGYKSDINQGVIEEDGTIRPSLPFARELFDIAIDGITKEYEADKLNKDLAVNNVVKSKTFKI